jgi:hypothetical protein
MGMSGNLHPPTALCQWKEHLVFFGQKIDFTLESLVHGNFYLFYCYYCEQDVFLIIGQRLLQFDNEYLALSLSAERSSRHI